MIQSDEQLILRIYDTVADSNRWAEVLDEVVDRVSAQGSIIFEWADTVDGRVLTAPLHSGLYSQDVLSVYLSKCQDLEARDQAIIRRETNEGDAVELIDDSVLASSLNELKSQEHVKKLMRLGILHRAAGVMNKDNQWISLFSVQLNIARGPLTGEERAFLSKILPHLAKAIDLGIPTRQLQQRYEGILSAIDKLSIGICVLDARGCVVARNDEFQRQQESYRLFRIRADGRLHMADTKGQKSLEALMDSPRQHGKFGARPRKECILSHTNDALCVEIIPLHRLDEMGASPFRGFLLCSTDASLPVTFNVNHVQQAFDLTQTETSIVNSIGRGLTNPEIADRRGRSVSTINAQTKSILSKTGCSNRTQFVRMMMRYGGSFLTPEV